MKESSIQLSLSVTVDSIAQGISDRKGFDLIKAIDAYRADWDFTERVVLELTKALIDECAGAELQSFKGKLLRLLSE